MKSDLRILMVVALKVPVRVIAVASLDWVRDRGVFEGMRRGSRESKARR